MEFGRVEPGELKHINFELPADPAQTNKTLQGSRPSADLDLRIGAMKWGRKEWLDNFNAAKIKETEFLKEYVKHFNSLFLNATFYQVYGPEHISKWKEMSVANPDLKFYPRLPQNISHIRRLKNTQELTEKYLEGVRALGDQLGPSLLQVGDNFTPKNLAD